jgi:hypothetical protein
MAFKSQFPNARMTITIYQKESGEARLVENSEFTPTFRKDGYLCRKHSQAIARAIQGLYKNEIVDIKISF